MATKIHLLNGRDVLVTDDIHIVSEGICASIEDPERNPVMVQLMGLAEGIHVNAHMVTHLESVEASYPVNSP